MTQNKSIHIKLLVSRGRGRRLCSSPLASILSWLCDLNHYHLDPPCPQCTDVQHATIRLSKSFGGKINANLPRRSQNFLFLSLTLHHKPWKNLSPRYAPAQSLNLQAPPGQLPRRRPAPRRGALRLGRHRRLHGRRGRARGGEELLVGLGGGGDPLGHHAGEDVEVDRLGEVVAHARVQALRAPPVRRAALQTRGPATTPR